MPPSHPSLQPIADSLKPACLSVANRQLEVIEVEAAVGVGCGGDAEPRDLVEGGAREGQRQRRFLAAAARFQRVGAGAARAEREGDLEGRPRAGLERADGLAVGLDRAVACDGDRRAGLARALAAQLRDERRRVTLGQTR